MKDIQNQLSDAVKNLDIEKVVYCLERGADLNHKYKNGGNIFVIAATTSLYPFGEGSKLTAKQRKALELEEIERFKIMKLLADKSDISRNRKKNLANGYLFTAVCQAKVEFVKFLLKNGANPNINDDKKESPEIISTVLDTAYENEFKFSKELSKRFRKIIDLLEKAGAIRYDSKKLQNKKRVSQKPTKELPKKLEKILKLLE
jgi:ankyrin repeat protein